MKTQLARPARPPAGHRVSRNPLASALFRGLRAWCEHDKGAANEMAPIMLLLLLATQAEPASFGFLADHLGLRRYHLSRLCTRMQAQGLLSRANDVRDMRLRRITLLTPGRAALDALLGPLSALLN